MYSRMVQFTPLQTYKLFILSPRTLVRAVWSKCLQLLRKILDVLEITVYFPCKSISDLPYLYSAKKKHTFSLSYSKLIPYTKERCCLAEYDFVSQYIPCGLEISFIW
jgi:hypothetical protein